MEFNHLVPILSVLTPLLVASSGELILEKSGIINLGIEGIMLFGAFVGWYLEVFSDGVILPIFTIVGLSIFVGSIFWFLIDILEVSQHIAGLGIGFTCTGLALSWYRVLPVEILNAPVEQSMNISVILAVIISTIVCIALIHSFMNKGGLGKRWKLVGENLRSADLMGISYGRYRWFSSMTAIFFALMAGYILSSIVVTEGFSMGIISGRGWISLCLLILARWNWYLLIVACIGWSILDVLALQTQITNQLVPYNLTLSIPYLCGILFVAIYGSGGSMPKMLLRKYNRNEDAS